MSGLTSRDLDSGVPHGRELTAFAEDIVLRSATLAESRSGVARTLGSAAMVDAAGVASNFERMVRIADATGIELGHYLEDVSGDVRTELGLQRPAGR